MTTKKADGRPSMRRKPGSMPPATDEAKAEAFIAGAELEASAATIAPRLPKKPEPDETVVFNLRMPAPLHADLKAVSEATGYSMHQVCLLILEPAIKAERERLG